MTDKSAMGRKKVFNDFYFNVGRALIQMEEEASRLLEQEQAQKPPMDMAGLVEELEAWGNKAVLEFNVCNINWAAFDEILSRYAHPTSGQEGEGAALASMGEELSCKNCEYNYGNSHGKCATCKCYCNHKKIIRHSADKCGELVRRLRAHIKTQKEAEADYLGYEEIETILDEFEKEGI